MHRHWADFPFESWTLTANGVTVTNEIHMEDYEALDSLGMLFPIEGSLQNLHLTFIMENTE